MTPLFVALALSLYAAVLFSAPRLRLPRARLAAGLGLWLVLQAFLAQAGFFAEFSAIPPRFALVLVPNFALLAFAAASPRLSAGWSGFSPVPLVAFQAFRIVMEAVLYSLVHQGRLPEILTFTGDNFDIVVGASAPAMAFALSRWGSRAYLPALAWNAAGLAILGNTVVHGVLAVPTPFQVFHTTPPNTLIAEFPWIWLPGFVVPVALIGHVLSIRQLLAARRP